MPTQINVPVQFLTVYVRNVCQTLCVADSLIIENTCQALMTNQENHDDRT